MARIFAYIEHRGGAADDTAAELAAAARAIDPAAAPTALVTGWGPELDAVASALRAVYGEVWTLGAEALAHPNAELVRQALVAVVPPGSIVLTPHAHFGLDLSPGLSIKLGASFAADVLAIEGLKGTTLEVVRQEFGGQVSAHVRCDLSAGAVISVRPGAFEPAGAAANGTVVDKSGELPALTSRRRYLETIVAESGDVDITKYATLVSVGRGIQEQDNVGLAQELADVMGAALSCSRPVVDAKWLEKSRQVGSSGKTVKPKVYLACGISGSFQHLAGIKGSPLIVAINKNARAPIFQVADVGVVDDILEFLPALTEKLRERQGAAS
jgi:electron transfer flavoprotein alpha subunit